MSYQKTILQASYGDSSGAATIIVTTLIFIGILLVVFFIIRALVLWYWKIDVIVKNQETQIDIFRRDARINYYKYSTLGDKEKAYQCLLYIFFHDLTIPGIAGDMRKQKYQELKASYADLFTKLGYEFPGYPW